MSESETSRGIPPHSASQPRPLGIGIGIIGAGWMGHVHARAFARVRHHVPDIGWAPRVVAVADAVPGQLEDFTSRHGALAAYADWRDLLADPGVAAVSVTAPNWLHAELGVAVAEAGKHLWIEKPVGLSAADARAVAAAVERAGVVSCVGFNYRQVPAVARARELIRAGVIGTPSHARIALFTDYAAHPGGPLSWRYTLEQGGHGVLGDLASHGIDMIRFLLGDLDRLVADTAVFIGERPIVDAGSSHYAVVDPSDPSVPRGPVENEDFVSALIRTESGALVTLESSRAAVGEQNHYAVEVHGTQGFVRWDFRRPGELEFSTGTSYQSQPSTVAFSGPGDGSYAAFQPGAGIAMSYDDTKVIEAAAFLRAIAQAAGQSVVDAHDSLPTMHDAVASAVALDAIVASVRTRTWVDARP